MRGISFGLRFARAPSFGRSLFAPITAIALLLCIASCAKKEEQEAGPSLRFDRDGAQVLSMRFDELIAVAAPTTVSTFDPYYREQKRFRALALAPLLLRAYGLDRARLERATFVLRAADGYAVPIPGERLMNDGAFLAYDDVDVPGFAPIGPRRVSPAPAYLVWSGNEHGDLTTHPRPWQLVSIALERPEVAFPHTAPSGEAADSLAARGYKTFLERCIRCHAVNREGGRVGPDLNVPRSVIEYRPEEQIREYIVNPASFRYGAMPSHRDLTNEDLDGLIAYLRAMSTRKHEPSQGEASE